MGKVILAMKRGCTEIDEAYVEKILKRQGVLVVSVKTWLIKRKFSFLSEKLSFRFMVPLFVSFQNNMLLFFYIQMGTVVRLLNMFKKTCIFRRPWRGRLPPILLVCRTRFQRGTRDSTVDWIESLSRKEHHLNRQGGQLKWRENHAKLNKNERMVKVYFVLRLNLLCGYKRWIWGFS